MAKKRDRTAYHREYQRKRRARLKAEKLSQSDCPIPPVCHADLPDDPIDALCAWSEENLRVPYGHKHAGQPLVIPEFAANFLNDAVTHREAGLFVARKNIKSATCAVYLLGRLIGPIAFKGWRGGICSVSKEKASELKQQIIDIAEMSGLTDKLKIYRSPAPGGRIESATGKLDILAADATSGHASGFDDVLFDELGLLTERHRALINGLRTSTSARDGRFTAISICSDSPFVEEMIQRRNEPDTAIHLFTSPANARIDDESAWHASNPCLKLGIKSMEYMRAECRRVQHTPADAAHFRAFDLNTKQAPDRIMIIDADSWIKNCSGMAPYLGDPVMAADLGGSASMTCATAYWPESGAMRCWGGFGDVPSIKERAMADGMGDKYERMIAAGELRLFPGRVTPVVDFLQWVFNTIDGNVQVIGLDRYRRAEAEEVFTKAKINVPVQWRGQGAGHTADGSRDVLSFQRLCLSGNLHAGRSLMLECAILDSSIIMDASGNQKINRARSRGRIDALQAGVIAAGLGERAIAMKSATSETVIAVAG